MRSLAESVGLSAAWQDRASWSCSSASPHLLPPWSIYRMWWHRISPIAKTAPRRGCSSLAVEERRGAPFWCYLGSIVLQAHGCSKEMLSEWFDPTETLYKPGQPLRCRISAASLLPLQQGRPLSKTSYPARVGHSIQSICHLRCCCLHALTNFSQVLDRNSPTTF